MIDGWRDPRSPAIPDVALTGDEFIHMLAIFAEVLPGSMTAHPLNRMPLGHPSPDCSCCQSIMHRSRSFVEYLEREGLAR
jgi:hypothetical protein